MYTPERLIELFEGFEKKVLDNTINDAESDELSYFVTRNGVQLREVIPDYEKRCTRMADHFLYGLDRWLLTKSDGCGKCRGCEMAREARERLIGN